MRYLLHHRVRYFIPHNDTFASVPLSGHEPALARFASSAPDGLCMPRLHACWPPQGEPPASTGKVVLRELFPEVTSAGRRKDPIEVREALSLPTVCATSYPSQCGRSVLIVDR